MKALTYFLDLEEPVLASRPFAGEANSAVSYPYVPGSMIRGAVVALYLRQHPQDDLAGSDEGRRLFFDGAVRYLHAYPVLRPEGKPAEQRSLPRPLSWVQKKDDVGVPGSDVYDRAVQPVDGPDYKAPQADFTRLRGDTAYLLEPTRQVMVHNASTDRNVKQQGTSQVYRYESLAPGQTLAGVILSDDEEALGQIKGWLEEAETLYLGGSHTGGYGCARLRQVDVADWPGEVSGGPDVVGDQVIVTLLSDALLRGGSPARRLADALGVAEEAECAFYDVSLVGGFNRKWGMPLTQDWALAAGSVFCFPATAVDHDRLRAAIRNGIGARRTEGYGRLAVNWQSMAELVAEEVAERGPDPLETLSEQSQKIAERMASALLRATLDERLVQTIRDAEYAGLRHLPSPSQLSRVRLAARHTVLSQDGNPIQAHLNSLTGAKSEWESARQGDQKLLTWIGQVSDLDNDSFQEVFQIDRLPTVAGQKAVVDEALRREYGARLVDGVMKVAIQMQKGERQ